MNFKALGNTFASTGKYIGIRMVKHSPTILAVAGTAGIITAAVMACKATLKLEDTMTESKDKIDEVKDALADAQADPEAEGAKDYIERGYKKDLVKGYLQMGLNLGKLYGPAILVGAASIACIFSSKKILENRYSACLAACTTTERLFADYRKRVVDELGKDADIRFRHGIRQEEVEIPEYDKKGNIKKDKDGNDKYKVEKVSVVENGIPEGHSEYARFFDELSTEYDRSSEYNKNYILAQQRILNQKLHEQGYLFLNDAYEALGLPKSKAGQVVGWIYDRDHQSYVDFGMFDVYRLSNDERLQKSAFINGQEPSILLDFNVDGVIIDEVFRFGFRK